MSGDSDARKRLLAYAMLGASLRLCETPDGCTCGAPASTPRGMHHDDCGIRREQDNPSEAVDRG